MKKMLTKKALNHLKKYFCEELKSYQIEIKKVEAGKVVTCEKLCLTEKRPSDTMPKSTKNPRKSRRK